MPNISEDLLSREMGLWMSFSEICMCVVFIVIYFSILSVRQIVEIKENRYAFRILSYLGKTNSQRRLIVMKEIILKYAFPALMCVLILMPCVRPVNNLLNSFLLTGNLTLTAISIFTGCFLSMYAGYAVIAYKMSEYAAQGKVHLA